MVVFPGCKINIGLNIINKRTDGYHNLQSVFYPLSLSDILEIIPADTFQYTQTGLTVPGDVESNLVVKAYRLLEKDFDIPPVKIHLHKVVPMGAGLGGGSADASSTLLIINTLFKLNLSNTTLINYAEKLGSDCPFFVLNQPAFAEGKGEQLSPLPLNLEKYYIKLINPGIHISTQMAFQGIPFCTDPIAADYVLNTPIAEWKNEIQNAFEATVFPNYPEIEDLKNQLYAEGAIFAAMTGTGSSVYGIFEQVPEKSPSSHYQWITRLN